MKRITFIVLTFFICIALFSQSISNNLDFDGVDDYVAIPGGTGMISGLSSFSMC